MLNLSHKRIILASQSPRRKELLKGLDIDFVTRSADIDEIYPDSLKAEQIPLYLAEQKANAMLSDLQKDDILITADTIVWINNKAVNKPTDRDDAFKMISNLSGSQHTVYTGVQLTTTEQKISFFSETKVYFSNLDEQEINYYLDTYKPYDKAGAYGIQEWIGYIGIEKIEGSYYNVMGFPLHQVYKNLMKIK